MNPLRQFDPPANPALPRSAASSDRRRLHKSRQRPAAAGHEPGSRLRFLKAFVRAPLRVGSVWPSSPALSSVMADSCDIEAGATVVELGAGTGAFTGPLLRRIQGRGRLLAFEIDERHAALLRRRFPGSTIIHDSAENLPRYVGAHRASCVVSGLPWGNMRPQLQDRILGAILRSLAPGGQFLAFGYVHAAVLPSTRRFQGLLAEHFSSVTTTPIVWRNFPPAYVYQCRTDANGGPAGR